MIESFSYYQDVATKEREFKNIKNKDSKEKYCYDKENSCYSYQKNNSDGTLSIYCWNENFGNSKTVDSNGFEYEIYTFEENNGNSKVIYDADGDGSPEYYEFSFNYVDENGKYHDECVEFDKNGLNTTTTIDEFGNILYKSESADENSIIENSETAYKELLEKYEELK